MKYPLKSPGIHMKIEWNIIGTRMKYPLKAPGIHMKYLLKWTRYSYEISIENEISLNQESYEISIETPGIHMKYPKYPGKMKYPLKLPGIHMKILVKYPRIRMKYPLKYLRYLYEKSQWNRQISKWKQYEIDNEIFMKCPFDILLQLMSESGI